MHAGTGSLCLVLGEGCRTSWQSQSWVVCRCLLALKRGLKGGHRLGWRGGKSPRETWRCMRVVRLLRVWMLVVVWEGQRG